MSKRPKIDCVLLVDDDMVYRMMVEYLFKHFYSEIEFIAVQETERVVQAFKNHSPQLLILDVNLPIQSGWEVLSDIEVVLEKEKRTKPYIVMSSSSVGLDDRKKAEDKLSVDAYIEKPLTYEKLKSLMETYAE